MAKIETVRINHYKMIHANTSHIVGEGCRNDINDVMLIQALFKIIRHDEATAEQFFGLVKDKLPEPTGDFDTKTGEAIMVLQLNVMHRLLKVDTVIHPANYKGRTLKNAHKADSRLMTITLLNYYALDGAHLMGFAGDIIPAVRHIAPSIVFER